MRRNVRTTGMLLATLCAVWQAAAAAADKESVKYCRFQAGETVAYGMIERDLVRQIEGDLFGKWKRTDKTHSLTEVKLLVPCRPTQVLAMAGNYKSHLGGNDVVTTVTTTTTVTTNASTGDTKSDSKTKVETVKPGEVPEK